jgi:hypothetical protein
MRPADRPGPRSGGLLRAGVLILAFSGLAAGCSSSKPAYCTDASQLKTSVQNLAAALNTALSGLQTAITSAKGQPPLAAATAVASSVTQVKNSADALQSAASGNCQ